MLQLVRFQVQINDLLIHFFGALPKLLRVQRHYFDVLDLQFIELFEDLRCQLVHLLNFERVGFVFSAYTLDLVLMRLDNILVASHLTLHARREGRHIVLQLRNSFIKFLDGLDLSLQDLNLVFGFQELLAHIINL